MHTLHKHRERERDTNTPNEIHKHPYPAWMSPPLGLVLLALHIEMLKTGAFTSPEPPPLLSKSPLFPPKHFQVYRYLCITSGDPSCFCGLQTGVRNLCGCGPFTVSTYSICGGSSKLRHLNIVLLPCICNKQRKLKLGVLER